MNSMEKEQITVIGAGTMGGGIAEVFAVAGHSVRLFDVFDDALERGRKAIAKRLEAMAKRGRLSEDPKIVLERIESIHRLEDSVESAVVIEAATERVDVKGDLFRALDDMHPETTLLATNTSSLSVTEIASVVKHRQRVIGMHFFNPAPRMPLVEVVQTRFSSDNAVAYALGLCERAGKVPIRVSDTPSFIVNRVARPFYGEAIRIVGERTATVHQVDRIMKSAGFKMGPFELQDLIGLDINFAATRSTYEAFFGEPRYRPHPLQQMMVRAGLLGKKTGRGYYDYES